MNPGKSGLLLLGLMLLSRSGLAGSVNCDPMAWDLMRLEQKIESLKSCTKDLQRENELLQTKVWALKARLDTNETLEKRRPRSSKPSK
jgi:regulator of replication initiation timing